MTHEWVITEMRLRARTSTHDRSSSPGGIISNVRVRLFQTGKRTDALNWGWRGIQGYTSGGGWGACVAAPSLSLRGEGIVSADVGDSYPIGSAARFYLRCLRVRVFLVDVVTWLDPWGEGVLANASRGIPGFAG